MVRIYWEPQEAGLCGVHCLNTLLQGPYFTAVDLMTIARHLDEQERQAMMEMGHETPEFLKYMAEDSGNVGDDGNFSLQVLSEALNTWGLHAVPLRSPEAVDFLQDPTKADAMICNRDDHWFTIRKLEGQFYNLNSLNKAPEHISDFCLSVLIDTLVRSGYAIFVLLGSLPAAGQSLELSSGGTGNWYNVPAGGRGPVPRHVVHNVDDDDEEDEDDELQAAIRASLAHQPSAATSTPVPIIVPDSPAQDDDSDLLAAIALSMTAAAVVELPVEPKEDHPLAVQLAIRLPSGNRLVRRFLSSDTLQLVYEFVRRSDASLTPERFELVSMVPPKQNYRQMDASLEQVGIVGAVQLLLRPLGG